MVNAGRLRGPALVLEAKSTFTHHQPWTDSNKDFHVVVSPWGYRLWWMSVAAVHVICAGKYGFECYVYWWIPATNIAFTLEMYGIIMPLSDFHVLSLVHAAIAAAHGLLLLGMVGGSIYARHLVFLTKNPFHWRQCSNKIAPSDVAKPPIKLIVWLKNICDTLSRVFDSIFGKRGLLGIEGKHFAYVYIGRELFETVLQSIQAYSMSQLVPHVVGHQPFLCTDYRPELLVHTSDSALVC